MNKYWIYDLETFPNVFTFSILSEDRKIARKFQCSIIKNNIKSILACLDYLQEQDAIMVGFNNLGFDYPILHDLLERRERALSMTGEELAKMMYQFAQDQIESSRKNNGFPRVIKTEDEYVKQLDLYKIHHFDNKTKRTSLKLLQFNMRSATIEELPFEIGQVLTPQEIETLLDYNFHDVDKTTDFFFISKSAIDFREELSKKFGKDFTNHNDTKVGKDYFIQKLEEQGIRTRKYNKGKWELVQTKRPYVKIIDVLFNYYDFKEPAFLAVLEWFKRQRIIETKGIFTELDEFDLGDVSKYANMRIRSEKIKCMSNDGPTDSELAPYFKMHPKGKVRRETLKATLKGKLPKYSYWFDWFEADVLNVVVNGFQFDFGVGGIHGSMTESVIVSDDEYLIKDADITSMYPNLAISNNVYPLHLTEQFCSIYKDVFEERMKYPKTSVESKMLKLALNGVYGDSNNKFSPFYDPQYTMTITINGQLSLCLLAEKLMSIESLSIIQINTDGITVKMKRSDEARYNEICKLWEQQVKLNLEFVEYQKMIIRDVNNYIAVSKEGKIKYKGAYNYKDLEWYKNQGGLVVKKAAEAFMLHGIDIDTFVRNHKDPFDFCLRVKVPGNSRLQLETNTAPWIDNSEPKVALQQNICRYYVAKNGGQLIKIMPPLPSKPENGERRFVQAGGNLVKTCNNMKDFDWDIDYDFYIKEAVKLVIGKRSDLDEDTEGTDDE